MSRKIDKNYLTKSLMVFDDNNNQIIEPAEWLNYFSAFTNESDKWDVLKDLLNDILSKVFPNDDAARLPVLVNAILMSHTLKNNKAGTKELDLIKLYNYIIRFIAPQKYRDYQETLENKTDFFLYDGVIEYAEFSMFTDKNNRLLTADLYYTMVSYHISPYIVAQIIEHLKKDSITQYKPDDFSMDANGVFSVLSIDKNKEKIIDIDALINYTQKCGIKHHHVDDICHLFGIHNDLLKQIQQNKSADYQMAYWFFNYHNKIYLEIALNSLFTSMEIEVEDIYDVIKMLDYLGLIGKPEAIFKTLTDTQNHFVISDIIRFFDVHDIPYQMIT